MTEGDEVSELDDRLRAQGGACEHLAKLFAYKRGMAESDFPCPPLSTTPWADALTQLLARIAELEAENGSLADDVCSMTGAYERAERAEAELAALKARRCEGCHYVICDEDCSPFPWYCTCEESMLHDSVTDPDSACPSWTARAFAEPYSLSEDDDGFGIHTQSQARAEEGSGVG